MEELPTTTVAHLHESIGRVRGINFHRWGGVDGAICSLGGGHGTKNHVAEWAVHSLAHDVR